MGEGNEKITLGEAAARYLASLPPEAREASQQEVNRFVRWYGWAKPIAQLSPVEVADYAERAAGAVDPQRKLEPVHRFLSFARSQKLTPVNLAAHLKVKKGAGRALVGGHRMAASAALTAQGYQELKEHLLALQLERQQVLVEVKRAREDKDFRENAPLEAARERLAHIESRVREIEALLAGARVTEGPADSRVDLGSTVTLLFPALGQTLTYTLVDAGEANPTKGRISITSPLGKALLGKQTGEEVEVVTPGGSFRYQVQSLAQ